MVIVQMMTETTNHGIERSFWLVMIARINVMTAPRVEPINAETIIRNPMRVMRETPVPCTGNRASLSSSRTATAHTTMDTEKVRMAKNPSLQN